MWPHAAFFCIYALFVVIFKLLALNRPKLARYKLDGFGLFPENPVIRFFLSHFFRIQRKILAYWQWSREILTERLSVIWCFTF